jgi:hypothetical protein
MYATMLSSDMFLHCICSSFIYHPVSLSLYIPVTFEQILLTQKRNSTCACHGREQRSVVGSLTLLSQALLNVQIPPFLHVCVISEDCIYNNNNEADQCYRTTVTVGYSGIHES